MLFVQKQKGRKKNNIHKEIIPCGIVLLYFIFSIDGILWGIQKYKKVEKFVRRLSDSFSAIHVFIIITTTVTITIIIIIINNIKPIG